MPGVVFLFAALAFIILTACSDNLFQQAPLTAQPVVASRTLSLEDVSHRAAQGDEAAVLELARRYAEGEQVAQDGMVALRLYQALVDAGGDHITLAQMRIGRLYIDGVPPLKQDLVEAYLWFDRIIRDHGKFVTVDNEPVLRYHNFARLNMTDAERVALARRLQQEQ